MEQHVGNALFITAAWKLIACIRHSSAQHPSVDEHYGCFQLVAITNNSVMMSILVISPFVVQKHSKK